MLHVYSYTQFVSSNVLINHTDIEMISDDLFSNLTSVENFNLTITNSWWSCDCSKLKFLEKAASMKNLNISCRVPFKHKGRRFDSLRKSDLICSRPNHPRAQPVKEMIQKI